MVILTKITSIAVHERKSGNTSAPQIFGVGDDGQVYEWSYSENGWKPYTSKEN